MSEALRLAQQLAKTPRILVIDDESVIHIAFRKLAENYDLDLQSAAVPQDGLDLSKKLPFDVVFLDMKFEGSMSGMDVLRALNLANYPAQVVVMSGSVNLHDIMAEANALGVISFMVKPVKFDAEYLKRMLTRLGVRLHPRQELAVPDEGNLAALI